MKTNDGRYRLEIRGAMSKRGADRVGNKLANAALIVAISISVAIVGHFVSGWG